MPKATSVVDVILGEAVSGNREDRFNDMLGIASVIDNRSARGAVTPEQVVANKNEFNAYDKALPAGVEAYRSLAEQAWAQVQTYGPVHNGMFYATEAAKGNLPRGLEEVDRTKGHVFFDDPNNRSFAIQGGNYVQPAPERQALAEAYNPMIDTALPGLAMPDVPQTAYAPNLTSPAQYAFADLLAPTPVQTTSVTPSVPSIAPEAPRSTPTAQAGMGLASLAPNGLIGDANYGRVGYSHESTRGPWSTNMTPAAVDSINMLSNMNPEGIQVNSAYRSPAVNASVDGRRNSEHMRGNAYDISLKGMTPEEKALTVEQARMSGATRIGAYKDSDIIHVDFAQGYGPKTNYSVDTYPMYEMSYHNMAAAPGWFTEGLAQTTVPTPTSRDDALSNVLADQAATTQAYQEMALGLGAAGIPNVGGTSSTFAAPVGDVERASLPDIPSVPEAVLNDYAQTVAPAGFDFSVPTAPTQVASLAPAPVDSVERSSLPSLAPAPAVPSTTDMANAYGQLASTMTQAGVTGLGAMPSTPSVPSATTFASLPNTLTAPANTFQSTTPAPVATSVPTVPSTPAAPAVTAPSINTAPAVPTPSATPAAPKSESPSLGSRLGHAAIGGAIGGLPGAVIGGLFGPAITSTTKDVLGGIGKSVGLNTNTSPSTSSKSTGTGLGGFLGGLGDVFSGQSNITMPESTYSVGKGVDAIGGVFSGAFGPGATAISLGNPNVSFTDLGNGNVAKVNSELGTTSLVNASSFNWSGGTQGNGKSSSASSWGLGDVFGGLGDAVSDAFSGWGGDASASSYSGPNSTTDPSDSW